MRWRYRADMSFLGTTASPISWESAWFHANEVFYRTHQAEREFLTSPHVDAAVAEQLVAILHRYADVEDASHDVCVIDVGAGSGELLLQMSKLLTGRARFLGIDRRKRPDHLPADIEWRQIDVSPETGQVTGFDGELPGILIAHEFLDDIPCPVVELDDQLVPRLVLVDPHSGQEIIGPACSNDVEASAWLDRWWPATQPMARREIGVPRDRMWQRLRRCLRSGVAVAIDYAHGLNERQRGLWDAGTVKGFADGRPRRPLPDGSVNITAHVALDSCSSSSGQLLSQSSVLGSSTLTSWPGALGSYTWLIDPVDNTPTDGTMTP